MKSSGIIILVLSTFIFSLALTSPKFEEDIIPTAEGPLKITFLGHATLYLTFKNMVIHIDPVSKYADYSQLPQADLILITHEHFDHLDPEAIEKIKTDSTVIIYTKKCAEIVPVGKILHNGENIKIKGILIEAIPAYNIKHMRSPGVPFHPKGVGNGYILNLADKRIYIAGDTENTPEMKALKNIDVAFLPMNLPYTMTPEMVADAAKAFRPKILYPYHYGQTDPQRLVELLKDTPEIEVRIRKMR